MWFSNLVSLLPESKIKRAILLAVCQNINTVFTGDCSSLREDEVFSTRMRCVKCASKKKQPQHDNGWRLETMNNTVPLFSADVSNVRKSNKRTVKGPWRELLKFRLKCLPYPPVLMFRSRRASRSETSCDTTLSDRQLGKFCDIRHWAPFLLIGDDVTLDFMAKERENLNMKSQKWKLFFTVKRMTQELGRFKCFSILALFGYFSLLFTFLLNGTWDV